MPCDPSSRRRCAANGRLAVLNAYSVRIMLGLAASLGVLVLCFRLPLLRELPRGVGWVPKASSPPLTLKDVREAGGTTGAKPQAGRPVTSFDVTGEATPEGEATPGNEQGERAAGPSEKSSSTKSNTSGDATSADRGARLARLPDPAPLYTLDRKPRVVGGLGGLYLRIDYPRAARRDSIEGLLLLRFVVEKDGSTSRVRVTRSLHPLCDSAAVRAIERTRFVPGRRGGKVVRVKMQLPVRFKLVEPDSTLRADRSST